MFCYFHPVQALRRPQSYSSSQFTHSWENISEDCWSCLRFNELLNASESLPKTLPSGLWFILAFWKKLTWCRYCTVLTERALRLKLKNPSQLEWGVLVIESLWATRCAHSLRDADTCPLGNWLMTPGPPSQPFPAFICTTWPLSAQNFMLRLEDYKGSFMWEYADNMN